MTFVTFAGTIILFIGVIYLGLRRLDTNPRIPTGTKLPPGPKGKPLYLTQAVNFILTSGKESQLLGTC